MIHAVKATPKFFEDVTSGKKPFEVRKNDRDYRECDYIALNEYDPDAAAPEREQYSGRSALFQISYILDNPEYCKEGYVILTITPCTVTTAGAVDVQRLAAIRPAVQVLYGQARGWTE